MISKELVSKLVAEKLVDTDCFLIDIEITQQNSIVVLIDSDTHVNLDFCVALSRHIEAMLDREQEDFDLEVGSYGISKPFAIERQYYKNIGNEVEVLTKTGEKIKGILLEVTPNGFAIENEKRIKIEGKKRKELIKEALTFNYADVKGTVLVF
ncbi:MAG: ribosome assembly cofactor RimP [Bacteroidales bacterium]|jgi:ribosome maturation factor RimP|nr:ribosome assembly cofactor RimP [Bacteroidales bacterium]